MTDQYRSQWPEASSANPQPSFLQPSTSPGYSPGPGYFAAPPRSDYATWGQRVRARLIDQGPTYLGLIIFYAGYLIWVIELARSSGSTPDFETAAVAMIIGLSVILASLTWVAYNRWKIAGKTGQSLGKRMTKIRLIGEVGMAGVPVYSRQGRNGGWQLVGGARTDLSGLNAAEARALFLVAGPSSSATPELKAALRKLVRALPETFRSEAEAASTAVIIDNSSWGRRDNPRPTPPYLDDLQNAVIEGMQVTLGYVGREGAPSTRVVHPLGLATKGPRWYLVADTDAGLRTFRVDRVRSVERTGEPVVRPDGFDLEESWRLVSDQVDELWAAVRARGTAVPESISMLRGILGSRLRIGADRARRSRRGGDRGPVAARAGGGARRLRVAARAPRTTRAARAARPDRRRAHRDLRLRRTCVNKRRYRPAQLTQVGG